MRRSNAISAIFTTVLLLTFFVYLGYQVSENLSNPILTTDALELDVEDKISTEGYFIRSETVVDISGSGQVQYFAENGEKVSKNHALAVSLSSDSEAEYYALYNELSSELEAVTQAYSSISTGADSAQTDSMIRTSVLALAQNTESGDASGAHQQYTNLQQLVLVRGADHTSEEMYKQRMDELTVQISEMEDAINTNKIVYSDNSGYFLHSSDGYEDLLTFESMEQLTPQSLSQLQSAGNTSHNAGVIVDQYKWYFVAEVTTEQADALKGKNSAEVYFPELFSEAIRLDIYKIESFGDSSLVTFESELMWEEFLTGREQYIDIVITSYSGIRVPREALRQVDGVWGVYCLEASIITFKPIDIIYQTDSYYLAECAETSSKGLYRYDKMIVSAKNLEDYTVVN